MSRPASREIEPWREAQLKCAIGHRYAGKVRVVQDPGADMDGERIWYPPREDYDPPTCVVCGLMTWATLPPVDA